MHRRPSALERVWALSSSTRLVVLFAVAVAAVPAALVTGSELGLTSGALAAAGAHPCVLALGAASMLGALTLTLERPRSPSLRAYGAQLAQRFQLNPPAAPARPDHQEQQP